MLVNDLKYAPIIVNPNHLSKEKKDNIESALYELAKRPVYPVGREITINKDGSIKILPDRQALDDNIFDLLELTQMDRQTVYKTVVKLVEDRLGKAESLSPKERRKRLSAAEKTGGIWAGLPEEEDNGE